MLAATRKSDPETVVQRRVTGEDEEQERRKLSILDKVKRLAFIEAKRVAHIRALARERKLQKRRIREAHYELWNMCVLFDETTTVEHMKRWLDMS